MKRAALRRAVGVDNRPRPIAYCVSRRTLAAMVAQHVELALFEQSLGNPYAMHRPFRDRVTDAAEKTAGSVLFDVRVDGDIRVQRMAAIGFGITGTAIIVMEKNGQLRCASINGDTAALVAELAAWDASPPSAQAQVDPLGTAAILLMKLRTSGHFAPL